MTVHHACLTSTDVQVQCVHQAYIWYDGDNRRSGDEYEGDNGRNGDEYDGDNDMV